METALQWVAQYGAVALFFLLMLGIIGLPVPDETLMVFSGYLIYKGTLNPVSTFSMALLGSVTGITVSYFLGRVYGLKLIQKYGRYFHLTETRYQQVHQWFERAGRWSLFFGYYIAGVRHFTALVAGATGLEYPIFAVFAYTGAFTWVLGFLSLGYFLGDRWQSASQQVHEYLTEAVIAIAVMAVIYVMIRKWRGKHIGPA